MADTCQEEPQARTAGFLQFRKTICCALNLWKSVQPASSIVKTGTWWWKPLQEIHRIPRGKHTNGLKMFSSTLYNQEYREALAEILNETSYIREGTSRITREQRAPRAVNKGVPSQHMREFTLFHLGCVPSWGHLWGIEDFTCPQSPKSVPRSCHKHLCSSFWLIISPPVARWGFSWWGKIILVHTNLRKTGRIMNLFWYYSSEKGGRGTSCPHLRWQPLLCHLKQFWNNCRSPSDPALSGTVANYYSPWNKNTQRLQLSWLSLI